jgi:hypothetical protein
VSNTEHPCEGERLREQLRQAIKSRAMVYFAVYEELTAELGEQRAVDILKRAIFKRGAAIAGHFAPHAPGDLEGLRDHFLGFIPEGEALFAPQVNRCDPEELDIHFQRCPLKEAWIEAGLPDSTVARLCEIAGVVDNGTFETAGFQLQSETWQPGLPGCCRLHIRPGQAPAGD